MLVVVGVTLSRMVAIVITHEVKVLVSDIIYLLVANRELVAQLLATEAEQGTSQI